MLKKFTRSIRMLGMFGLILLIALVAIVVALLNVNGFGEEQRILLERGEEYTLYQRVRNYFLNMQYTERQYLVFEDEEGFAQQDFGDLNDGVIEELDYGEQVLLLYLDQSLQTLEEFRQALNENFDTIVAGLEADTLTGEDLELIFAEEEQMNTTVAEFMFAAGQAAREQNQIVLDERWVATLVAVIGLSLFPLLALWAFIVASRVTQPMLDLTTVITAIGGQQYRPEILSHLKGRSGPIGEVASSFETMARTIETRRQGLEKQIEELRHNLYELQQSKLDIVQKGDSNA